MTKLKEFLFNKRNYLFLSGIVFGICLLIFVIGGVFPFGKNTFGTYDYYHQVIDLTANIFNVFNGRSGALFTFDLAGGSALYGNIAYCCLSPFSLILILAGPSNIIYMTPLMITAKLITIACVIYYFINKYFANLSEVYKILFALMYTISGYMGMTTTFPVWLDYMIYAPLLFISFDKLVTNGKITGLTIINIAMIVTSFSLGSFALIFLLFIYFAYILVCVPKENRARVITKLILSYAISFVITLPLTVPCLLQVLNGTRTNGLLKSLWHTPTFRFLAQKIGFLIPELILIVLNITYFVRNKIKSNFDKFLLIAFIFTFIPVIFDEVNMLLNFGQYACFANRFGFVYLIIHLYIAIRYINQVMVTDNDNLQSNKVMTAITWIASVFPIIVCLLSPAILAKAVSTQAFTESTFAVLSSMFLPPVLVLVILLACKNYKLVGKIQFSKMLVVLMCTFTALTSMTYLKGNTYDANATLNYNAYTKTITSVDPYARVKQVLTTGQLSRGFASHTGFSSLNDNNTVQNAYLLGYSLGNHNINSHNTAFADMLMGVTYEIHDEEVDTPYLEQVDKTSDSYLYRNKLSLNHAYYVNDLPTNLPNNFVESQNVIYKTLSNDTEDLIKTFSFDDTTTNYFKFDDVKLKKLNDGNYKLLCDSETASITIDYTNLTSANQIVYLRTVCTIGHFSASNQDYIPNTMLLDYVEGSTNDSLTKQINVVNGTIVTNFEVLVLNYDKLVNVYNTLSQNAPTVTYTKDSITVDYNNTSNNKYLVINHPMINGYSYTLNGKSVTPSEFVKMPAYNVENTTSGTVTLKYTYPYLNLTLILVGVGCVLGAMLIFGAITYNKFAVKLEKGVALISYGAITILSTALIVAPAILSVVKIIIAIFT